MIMLQNIVLIAIGVVFGLLVGGIVNSNMRITYICKLSKLQIEHNSVLEKNKRLFDDNQELKEQLDMLQSFIVDEFGDLDSLK